MIKNKRILLICRESYSFPLFFIAKKMLERNNQVAAFFVYPEESAYRKCYYNENTYFAFKEKLPQVRTFGLEDFCKEFNDIVFKSIPPDLDYLTTIENKYSYYKNLNLQLTSSQSTTRQYHTRPYYSYSTQEKNLIYLQLGYKKVLNVLDCFDPDVILDTEDSELLRSILNEIVHTKNIPYINIDYPRYEKYKIPTFCLGLNVERYFQDEYEKYFRLSTDNLRDEIFYIEQLRSKQNIMSSEFIGTITSQYSPPKLLTTIKYLIIKAKYFFSVYILKRNIKAVNKKNIIFTSPLKHLYFYFKVEIKKQFLYKKNRFFENPVIGEDYVYMPLHLIPESTTFVKAPFYVNELSIIEQVSKSLPITWKLYVKEHQSMVGERSLSFYRRIKKFPNVRLVQFNYYRDPKPWIDNSKGVITISGSGAYEAALLGKRSIIFADVPFRLIDGVSRINSFEELPSLISTFGNIDNIKSSAAYIAAVKSVGTEVNLKYLISEGEAIINGDTEISDQYKANIELLASFYDKAFLLYNHQQTDLKK